MSFAPSGITDDSEIRTASSLVDYIFKRLALNYLSFDDRLELGLASIDDMPETQTELIQNQPADTPDLKFVAKAEVVPSPSISQSVQQADRAPAPDKTASRVDSNAPLCYNCGNQTQRAGSCYVCASCGSTTGCS